MADSSDNPTLRIEDLVVAPVSKRQAAAENVPPAIPEVDIKTDAEFSKKTEYSILSDGKALYIIPYVDDVNVSELRSKITEDLNNVDLHNIKLPNDPERSFAFVKERTATVTESPATQFSRMTQRAARLDDILQETRRNAAAAMIIKHHVMAILDSGKDEVPPVTMQDLYASRQEAKRVIHRAVTIDDLARGDEGGMGLLAEIAERHTIAETLRRDRKSTQRG